MTAEQRERVRREIDRHKRGRLRRQYGRGWHAIQERVERELVDRARPSYLDMLAAGRQE